METTKSIKKIFGNRIRELRIGMGLSQEAFADKCGIDRTYVSGVERGVRNPTLVIVHALAKGLEIDLSHLFLFENEEKNNKRII